MSDELVKRLCDVAEARQVALDAANRIEKLEVKLDQVQWLLIESAVELEKGIKTMLIILVIFCIAVGFFLGWIFT